MTTLASLLTEVPSVDKGQDFAPLRQEALAKLQALMPLENANESWKYVDIPGVLDQVCADNQAAKVTISGHNTSAPSKTMKLGCSTSPFSYLNTAYFVDASSLVIDTTPVDPIIVTYQSTQMSHPRLNIHVKSGVKATIFVKSKLADQGIENRMIDVTLDDSAELSLIRLDTTAIGTRFSTLAASLQANAVFNSVSYIQNNPFTRHDTQIDFYGENASASVSGVGLLKETEQYFNHLSIHHHVGNCQCQQLFKTILADQSVSEFSGKVVVAEGAHGTDSSQLNQNLLLSDHARALSRPQLQIDADDVECAHGATVGQLNPDEVFYIRSRGLTEEGAKQLLTYGFAEEVLDKVESNDIRTQLQSHLKSEVSYYVNR